MPVTLNVLPGLPPYGETPKRFSSTGLGTQSEGLVVEFRSNEGPTWVGNFARGIAAFDWVGVHPNDHDALVVAGGQGYVVDPEARTLISTFGGAIVASIQYLPKRSVVFNHQGLFFEAVGASGHLWKSRRISWDGMRSIEIHEAILSGESWNALDDSWQEFRLDLNIGAVTGGSYPEETSS
jgi:hypothetical protein